MKYFLNAQDCDVCGKPTDQDFTHGHHCPDCPDVNGLENQASSQQGAFSPEVENKKWRGLKSLKKGFLRRVADGDTSWAKVKEKAQDMSMQDMAPLAYSAVFHCRCPSFHASTWLIRYIWQSKGAGNAAHKDVKKILRRFDVPYFHRFYSEPYARLKFLHAGMSVEAADARKTMEILRGIISKKDAGDHRILSSSIALGAFLSSTGVLDTAWTARCRSVMETTWQQENTFNKLLQDKSKSVCVVGNSPIEIGRGQGAHIDAHDVVIRFNNYSDSHEYHADYGSKTNIWMRAGKYADIWRRPVASYDLVLFSGPDRRYHGMGAIDVMEAVEAGAKTGFVPSRIYAELLKSLGHRPSAGLLLLYWIRQMRGNFAENNVSTFGFSMNDQSPNTSHQYFENLLRKKQYPHHWEREADFLRGNILT